MNAMSIAIAYVNGTFTPSEAVLITLSVVLPVATTVLVVSRARQSGRYVRDLDAILHGRARLGTKPPAYRGPERRQKARA